MDECLYLVHTVNSYNNKPGYDELRSSSIENIDDQFPGVYFSLITKTNIDKEELFNENNILIFSKKLLLQNNYHINIRDYNGFINEKNTYFSWQLDEAVKEINKIAINSDYYIGNEIVFHDNIPIKYLCLYIQYNNISNEIIKKNCSKSALYLPRFEIYNDILPDMNKIPFYCVPYESNYSGIDPFELSSKNFYIKMAKMCNIDIKEEDNIEYIINKIKEKIPELYKNRELLKIDEFRN